MASAVDSTAFFAQRRKEYAIPQELIDRLEAQGVTTMGHLAFSLGRPGQDVDDADFVRWITRINNNVEPPQGPLASARRLHFEAEVVVTASLKASIEGASDSQPKKITYAEKSSRMQQVKRELQGAVVEGVLEPSDEVLEICVHQYETRTLQYVEAAKCTSRDMELTGKAATVGFEYADCEGEQGVP
ncbi:unnamed protein product [Effrenium voratum]|uniref:Uncharacterized protein n=1 Tax=Effrenium voratum TaxID=2562239 RepID=A0AA36MRY2_9DINO|nr:unnamed protein product [Effrenium voratum]